MTGTQTGEDRIRLTSGHPPEETIEKRPLADGCTTNPQTTTCSGKSDSSGRTVHVRLRSSELVDTAGGRSRRAAGGEARRGPRLVSEGRLCGPKMPGEVTATLPRWKQLWHRRAACAVRTCHSGRFASPAWLALHRRTRPCRTTRPHSPCIGGPPVWSDDAGRAGRRGQEFDGPSLPDIEVSGEPRPCQGRPPRCCEPPRRGCLAVHRRAACAARRCTADQARR